MMEEWNFSASLGKHLAIKHSFKVANLKFLVFSSREGGGGKILQNSDVTFWRGGGCSGGKVLLFLHLTRFFTNFQARSFWKTGKFETRPSSRMSWQCWIARPPSFPWTSSELLRKRARTKRWKQGWRVPTLFVTTKKRKDFLTWMESARRHLSNA